MGKLFFGTGGTPHSSTSRASVAGVERIAELGLGCMELEFVRGVRMGAEKAAEVREVARELGVKLSAHGPYYINLNAKGRVKKRASIQRILATARVGAAAGAETITFHPAYYLKDPPGRVYETVREALAEITTTLRAEGNTVWVRPETTGKRTQFGSLDEIIRLSQEVPGVLPCIDFSHLHAREGKINSLEEFRGVLSAVEDALGREALKNMHNHVQGIEYTSKGERRHLNLADSDFKYKELLEAFKEYSVSGRIICESPSLEDDALKLKKTFENLD